MPDHVENGSSGHSLAFQRPSMPKREESVVMDDSTRDVATLQQSKPKFFTIHEDASEITYIPEDALKQGLKMVKAIKQTLIKLELSSRLRAEVWDREVVKFVHRYFYGNCYNADL